MNYSRTTEIIFAALSVIATLGGITATTLGWIAVSRVRRSAGRVRGLGLALFNALVFPLIALDWLLLLLLKICRIVFESRHPQPLSNLGFIAVCTALLVADVFIFRALWRKLGRPLPVESVPDAGARTSTSKSGSGKGCLIAAIIVFFTGLAFLAVIVAAWFYVRGRAHGPSGVPLPHRSAPAVNPPAVDSEAAYERGMEPTMLERVITDRARSMRRRAGAAFRPFECRAGLRHAAGVQARE